MHVGRCRRPRIASLPGLSDPGSRRRRRSRSRRQQANATIPPQRSSLHMALRRARQTAVPVDRRFGSDSAVGRQEGEAASRDGSVTAGRRIADDLGRADVPVHLPALEGNGRRPAPGTARGPRARAARTASARPAREHDHAGPFVGWKLASSLVVAIERDERARPAGGPAGSARCRARGAGPRARARRARPIRAASA